MLGKLASDHKSKMCPQGILKLFYYAEERQQGGDAGELSSALDFFLLSI